MNLRQIAPGILITVCALQGAQASAMGKKPQPMPNQIDQSEYPMVATNPYTDAEVSRSGDVDYGVKIKFINHGVKDIASETLPRLVRAVETIYSQCEGVRFHVDVLGIDQAPYTQEQDDIAVSNAGTMGLGDGFEKFFSKFPNSASTGFIAVHLFDYLDASGRKAAQGGQSGENWLGQAFGAAFMDNLWRDLRSPQERLGKLSDLGGNTVRLGMDTLKGAEKNELPLHINEVDVTGKPILDGWGNPIPVMAYRSYQSSLLAHEMGHILMETQSGFGTYVDHFCPGMGVTCPEAYLMTSGGSGDRHYLDLPKMKHVIGYSPLPKVEPEQCAALKANALVQVLSQAKAEN